MRRFENWDAAFWHYWLKNSVKEAERLADMVNPRDPTPRYGVPVNTETGLPLTENQEHHLDALTTAGGLLYAAMHNAEGSAQAGTMEEHVFTGERMKRAANLLEMALLLARKAALE